MGPQAGKARLLSVGRRADRVAPTALPPSAAPRGIEAPADIVSGLVSFCVDTEAEPADCTDVLADLLIANWEERKNPKRRSAASLSMRHNPRARAIHTRPNFGQSRGGDSAAVFLERSYHAPRRTQTASQHAPSQFPGPQADANPENPAPRPHPAPEREPAQPGPRPRAAGLKAIGTILEIRFAKGHFVT